MVVKTKAVFGLRWPKTDVMSVEITFHEGTLGSLEIFGLIKIALFNFTICYLELLSKLSRCQVITHITIINTV